MEIVCRRCNTVLSPGSGNLYEISLKAICDPYPPVLTDDDLITIRAKIVSLIRALEKSPAVDISEEVSMVRQFQLCNRCFRGLSDYIDGTDQP